MENVVMDDPKIEKALDYVDKIQNIVDKLSYESSYSDEFIEDVGTILSDLKDKLENAEDESEPNNDDSDEE
jgi:hypothetical protein